MSKPKNKLKRSVKLQLTNFLDTLETLPINGITSDSRQARKGYLFAALPGSKSNGSEFIEDAILHGSDYILAPSDYTLPDTHKDKVTIILSDNTRQDFAKIAAKFYKLQPKNIVAITGTSGKTSTASFVQQLWHLVGFENCASLGTLGIRGPKMRIAGKLTTPDTQSLHAALADLSAAGIDYLAMEASSHGLDQYRLDGVNIQAAAFTNLSRDHLDYHPDMQSYFDAKSRLFSDVLQKNGRAILNADDEYFEQLKNICEKQKHKVFSFGYAGEDLKILNRTAKPTGQELEFMLEGSSYKITLPLVGDFQVMNALCALALVMPYVDDVDMLVQSLGKLRGVPGRLQLVEGSQQGAIYIDYAHKPAALETILKTLREHTTNGLVCVFGCGGNRDKGKRGIMGEIANRLADTIIVTDDNPRYEEASDIRKEIMDAAPNAIEIADRKEAIKTAVKNLKKGDVLVIAGKGHEEGQIIGDTIHPFNDAQIVQDVIEGIKTK